MKENNILEFNFPSAYSKCLIHKTNSTFNLLQKTFPKKMAAVSVLFNDFKTTCCLCEFNC